MLRMFLITCVYGTPFRESIRTADYQTHSKTNSKKLIAIQPITQLVITS